MPKLTFAQLRGEFLTAARTDHPARRGTLQTMPAKLAGTFYANPRRCKGLRRGSGNCPFPKKRS